MDEQYLIVGGIPTLELQRTVTDQHNAGLTVIQQNYTGDDTWELILVKYQGMRVDPT
jgi:hypothetical protein